MAHRLGARQPCLHLELAKGTPDAECGGEQRRCGSAKGQSHERNCLLDSSSADYAVNSLSAPGANHDGPHDRTERTCRAHLSFLIE